MGKKARAAKVRSASCDAKFSQKSCKHDELFAVQRYDGEQSEKPRGPIEVGIYSFFSMFAVGSPDHINVNRIEQEVEIEINLECIEAPADW